MKLSYLCVLPLAFSFCIATVAAHADDNTQVEVKAKDHHGKQEFKMKVKRKGDHYVGVYNNREYVLRGDAVSHITTDGDYVIYGDISPDDRYIETTELQPVVVERREQPVIHEHETVIEKHDDPAIKVGPLKIGN